MKKIIVTIILINLVSLLSSKTRFYDELMPSQRAKFAIEWLETGKKFYEVKKYNKAKACFEHVNNLYPMGNEAKEARELLKKYFNVNIRYNEENQYSYFVKRGDSIKDPLKKINNYLMALELKQDKSLYHKIAYSYYLLNKNDDAKQYLNKAIEMGFPKDKIHPSLKSLIN